MPSALLRADRPRDQLLPVPLSPVISTVVGVDAICVMS
jgi:hypothetical protein